LVGQVGQRPKGGLVPGYHRDQWGGPGVGQGGPPSV